MFDLGETFGGMDAALKRVRCPVMVMGVQTDILFPIEQQREMANLLKESGELLWAIGPDRLSPLYLLRCLSHEVLLEQTVVQPQHKLWSDCLTLPYRCHPLPDINHVRTKVKPPGICSPPQTDVPPHRCAIPTDVPMPPPHPQKCHCSKYTTLCISSPCWFHTQLWVKQGSTQYY